MQGGALKGLQDVIGDTDTGSGIAQGFFDMNTIGGVQMVEMEKRGDNPKTPKPQRPELLMIYDLNII
jgi:hypothetical protein